MSATATTRAPWLSYGLILLAAVAVSILGGLVSAGSEDAWYAALEKSRLTPPDIVFAIVWPSLFTLMAIGAALVRRAAGSFEAASSALGLYFTQFIANLGWSYSFFGFQQPALAMVVLIALWLLVAAMFAAFWRWSRPAALLQLPYLGWVSFAGYLNGVIVWANG